MRTPPPRSLTPNGLRQAAVDALGTATTPLAAVAEVLRRDLSAAAVVLWRWDADLQRLSPLTGEGAGSPSAPTVLLGDAPSAQRPAEDTSAVDALLLHEGEVWGVVSVVADADELEPAVVAAAADALGGAIRAADRLERLAEEAHTDPLTGLVNRRVFDERTEAAFTRHLEEGGPLAVLMCDVNGLKVLNDTEGHEAGDRHLQDVGRCIRQALEGVEGATAARLGGDEFAVLLPDLHLDRVRRIADRLCRLASALQRGHGVACGVATTEIGFDGDITSVRQLLRLADAAQYRSKRSSSGDPVVAGEAVGGESGVDRRNRLHRPAHVDALSVGLDALVAVAGAQPDERVRAVAEAVSRALDAGGWWVSRVTPDGTSLVTVDSAVAREAADTQQAREQAEVGATFPLEAYPASAEALGGRGFGVELGSPDNDPAEEGVLVTSGFTAMAVAGATGPSGPWLLEICFDAISAYDRHVPEALRALVIAAVAT